tara:strand:+ start:131 stop:310 length:180 start_codon:yes stop_codon:yes gene_type:complete
MLNVSKEQEIFSIYRNSMFQRKYGLKKTFLKNKKSAENYQNIEFIIVENGSFDNFININ